MENSLNQERVSNPIESQKELDYKRVAAAIDYFSANYLLQPKLEDVAEHVNLSPFHFQRMFQNWAGVTPKQFLQYLSVGHAKEILRTKGVTLFDAAYETGLSGTGRLHDLFIKVEGMTPGEYKNGGAALDINYTFSDTPFGKILVASTQKGICHMGFVDVDDQDAMEQLKFKFPNATYNAIADQFQEHALNVFSQDWNKPDDIKLHLKGTAFQIKVWETLLAIPSAGLTTYSELAKTAGFTGACRAVGTAVGKNPIAFLIPCHRVIKSTGAFGQYRWGATRKSAIIGWEAAKASAIYL